MKRILFILAILPVVISSCKKLEEKPRQSLVVPQTLADFQGLADNVNVLNSNYPMLGDVSSDNHYLSASGYDGLLAPEDKTAYIWQKDVFNGAITIPEWDSSYQKVFYSNVILDGLEKLSSNDQVNTFNSIKGQALFSRANSFFMLAQIFANRYVPGINDSDLGIVLRLSSDLNKPSVRASLKSTYDQIIGDLELAKVLLPATPIYKTRAGKQAAMAILARVYLFIGDYDNAYKNADECLRLNSTLLNYNSVTGTSTTSSLFSQLNADVIFHATMVNGEALDADISFIDAELYSSFEVNDLRKVLFFIDNKNGSYSFRGNYNGASNIKFAGIGLDEVFLTKAECQVRLGRRSDGLTDLNSFLVTRYKSGLFIPRTASTDNEALAIILGERRKELINRGLRWLDLKRLNVDPRFSKVLRRTLKGVEYVLPPNDPRYTFPIPGYIIALNGIQQN